MSKIKIIGARPQLLGDTVFVEPILNYWKELYPNSDITWVLAKKCSQGFNFWKNHPLIDRVVISEDAEGNVYSFNGTEYNQKTDVLPFDIRIHDFNPNIPSNITYNSHNCVEMAWVMAGLNLEDYYNLPKDKQRPKLYFPFLGLHYRKTVAFWPVAGYSQGSTRSPSFEWSKELVASILSEGITVFHCGHFNEPKLSTHHNYFNLTDLPLFDQVKIAIDCDVSIGTDSGSHWLVGAYGKAPIINLLTYHMPNHTENPYALAPMHSDNYQVNFFHPNSCSDINHKEVLLEVKSFCYNYI